MPGTQDVQEPVDNIYGNCGYLKANPAQAHPVVKLRRTNFRMVQKVANTVGRVMSSGMSMAGKSGALVAKQVGSNCADAHICNPQVLPHFIVARISICLLSSISIIRCCKLLPFWQRPLSIWHLEGGDIILYMLQSLDQPELDARYVYVGVHADGPTRVLCFSETRDQYTHGTSEESIAELTRKLKSLEERAKVSLYHLFLCFCALQNAGFSGPTSFFGQGLCISIPHPLVHIRIALL